MITPIERLLTIPIVWHQEVAGGCEFYSNVEGELFQLTMNDYPDEPLYTLRWRESSFDLDDRPADWQFHTMTAQ